MPAEKTETIQPKRIEKNAQPILVAGLRRKYTFGKDDMNVPAQWDEFGAYFGKIPGQKGNVAYGLCFEPDGDSDHGFEYMCGVEVTEGIQKKDLPEGFEIKQLPSFSYAVFDHEGHVSGIRETCDAIWEEWIPVSGYKKPEKADFFFERYGENFDPQKGKGDIEIWVPVKA